LASRIWEARTNSAPRCAATGVAVQGYLVAQALRPPSPAWQVLEHWLGLAGAVKMQAKQVAKFRERYADGTRITPLSDDDDSGASSDEDDGR